MIMISSIKMSCVRKLLLMIWYIINPYLSRTNPLFRKKKRKKNIFFRKFKNICGTYYLLSIIGRIWVSIFNAKMRDKYSKRYVNKKFAMNMSEIIFVNDTNWDVLFASINYVLILWNLGCRDHLGQRSQSSP